MAVPTERPHFYIHSIQISILNQSKAPQGQVNTYPGCYLFLSVEKEPLNTFPWYGSTKTEKMYWNGDLICVSMAKLYSQNTVNLVPFRPKLPKPINITTHWKLSFSNLKTESYRGSTSPLGCQPTSVVQRNRIFISFLMSLRFQLSWWIVLIRSWLHCNQCSTGFDVFRTLGRNSQASREKILKSHLNTTLE